MARRLQNQTQISLFSQPAKKPEEAMKTIQLKSILKFLQFRILSKQNQRRGMGLHWLLWKKRHAYCMIRPSHIKKSSSRNPIHVSGVGSLSCQGRDKFIEEREL